MKIGRDKKYNGVLDIPEGDSGPVRVRHKIYPAGTKLDTTSLRGALFGQRGPKVTFAEETRWHELSEEGQGVWMTDLPIEQRQTDELIRHATGHVLVGGLGLGYAVVALAARKRVKSITVVERSADVIALTWEPTRARVAAMRSDLPLACVQADLFAYLGEKRHLPVELWPLFTWGLFDIWQMDGETVFHETIVPLRRLADGIVRKVECWNEDVMRGQLFQALATRRMMLESPEFSKDVSLDTLCNDKIDSVYIKWAAPFWQWFRDFGTTADKATVDFVMTRYAAEYGHPEFNDGRDLLERAQPRKPADATVTP